MRHLLYASIAVGLTPSDLLGAVGGYYPPPAPFMVGHSYASSKAPSSYYGYTNQVQSPQPVQYPPDDYDANEDMEDLKESSYNSTAQTVNPIYNNGFANRPVQNTQYAPPYAQNVSYDVQNPAARYINPQNPPPAPSVIIPPTRVPSDPWSGLIQIAEAALMKSINSPTPPTPTPQAQVENVNGPIAQMYPPQKQVYTPAQAQQLQLQPQQTMYTQQQQQPLAPMYQPQIMGDQNAYNFQAQQLQPQNMYAQQQQQPLAPIYQPQIMGDQNAYNAQAQQLQPQNMYAQQDQQPEDMYEQQEEQQQPMYAAQQQQPLPPIYTPQSVVDQNAYNFQAQQLQQQSMYEQQQPSQILSAGMQNYAPYNMQPGMQQSVQNDGAPGESYYQAMSSPVAQTAQVQYAPFPVAQFDQPNTQTGASYYQIPSAQVLEPMSTYSSPMPLQNTGPSYYTAFAPIDQGNIPVSVPTKAKKKQDEYEIVREVYFDDGSKEVYSDDGGEEVFPVRNG